MNRIRVHTQPCGALVHTYRLHDGRVLRVVGRTPRYSQPPSLTPATWILHWARTEFLAKKLNP